MVGTAYHSPAPGADPFVKVGDTVKAGDTIMIIEAMKTMNQIPAPASKRFKPFPSVLKNDSSSFKISFLIK